MVNYDFYRLNFVEREGLFVCFCYVGDNVFSFVMIFGSMSRMWLMFLLVVFCDKEKWIVLCSDCGGMFIVWSMCEGFIELEV